MCVGLTSRRITVKFLEAFFECSLWNSRFAIIAAEGLLAGFAIFYMAAVKKDDSEGAIKHGY